MRRVARAASRVQALTPPWYALRASAPGYLMGDSLVPLLTGQKLQNKRVLYMEHRASRAALFPDGIKVMLTDNPAGA
jgi:hypothetical protein